MPRQGRLDAPGALHHVIQRGNARARIFHQRGDYRAFAERLGTVLQQTRTSCLAWVLMPNHLHLLVRTGESPVGRVMQRVLTGYAVDYNRRYRHSGHVFQNRFKSILCEEEPYLLELVRYIHLNPVRAGLVSGLQGLARYEWSGHRTLLGIRETGWQDADGVLGMFGGRRGTARRAYEAFLREGMDRGEKPDLEGGGIIRSLGGMVEYVNERKGMKRLAGDERILGSERFVEQVLAKVAEREQARSRRRRGGWDLERVLVRAARLSGLRVGQLRGGGKTPARCRARSLVCYWAVEGLGMPTTIVAARLGISRPAVSANVPRGEAIARREKLAWSRP